MIKKPITIQIPSGLEARPVALLVQVASQFESDIYVESEQRRVGLTSGEDIMVSASGEDEQEAIANIEKYLSGKAN